MKKIPLYDATVPIVCTPPTTRSPSASPSSSACAPTSTGSNALGTVCCCIPCPTGHRRGAAAVHRRREGCCQFWGFEIDTSGEELTLRWDGPPNTAELMDRLLAFFRGHEPLTATSGVL